MPQPAATDPPPVEPLPFGSTDAERSFVAYELHPNTGFDLVPAPSNQAWMGATRERFANRCLPLLIANQAGWLVLNNTPLRMLWSGGDSLDSVTIEYQAQSSLFRATSHFGHGIVTWSLPFLFRTPPGYNLLVRGPANCVKDAISPLEGIVETDWSPATFTINWKLTRPHMWVEFEGGEPLCMLVPQRRGELEEFKPEIRDIDADPEWRSSYTAWQQEREQFLRELNFPDSVAKRRWQKHYFQGTMPDGSSAPAHQTRLRLRPFLRSDPT